MEDIFNIIVSVFGFACLILGIYTIIEAEIYFNVIRKQRRNKLKTNFLWQREWQGVR